MFTNVDVRGVSRGHCTTNGCECDGFTRPSSLESSSIQAAPLQCGWCCYCGHSPVSHSRLVIPEVASSSPGISSVNWGCTVQTPFRDQATLVHSAREGRTELETAHLASTSQLADVYPSKCEPASSPEPEPRAECEATPQSAAAWMRQESPLRHTPPQPESNSRPNATFVQESEPGLEPPRKRSCIEQGTEDEGWSSMSPTPTEACQEFSGCACGLGQKVEQLEHEKQDLMRQLTDAQNVAESLQLVKELKGLLHKADNGNIGVEPQKVDIGGGVMVDSMQLEQLLSHEHNTPSRFARRLIRMLFTNEELLGKSLFGKGCNRFKAANVEQKPALDPVRLNAVIAFTCKNFNTSPHQLKNSLSSMLSREIKGARE